LIFFTVVTLLALISSVTPPFQSNTQVSSCSISSEITDFVELWQFGFGSTYDSDLSPEGTRIAIASESGLYLRDVETLDPVQMITSNQSPHISYLVKWSPDGHYLAAASNEGSVNIWSISRQEMTAVLLSEDNQAEVISMAWSPNGQQLALLSETRLEVWSVDNEQLLFTHEARNFQQYPSSNLVS
jgi:WD40 repeat protein